MVFELEHKVTKKRYSFTVEDIGDSRLYYHFNMAFANIVDDGDYEYWLYDEENNMLAQGVCQVGDYVPPTGSTTTYKPASGTTYIQYQGSI